MIFFISFFFFFLYPKSLPYTFSSIGTVESSIYSSTSSFVTDFLSFKNLSKPVNFNSSVFTPGVFEIIFKISLPGAFLLFNFFTASDKAENTLGPYFNVAPTAAVPRAQDL